MKVLSIGNSFSQDAHSMLHRLTAANGEDITTANLFIGGCELKRHWYNVMRKKEPYELEINGEAAQRTITIIEALRMDKWDAVTLQQASMLSGIQASYIPYVKDLANVVHRILPEAKLYIHETWAYDNGCEHDGFDAYHNDQHEMFKKLKSAYKMAVSLTKAEIIPTGTVIQKLRDTVPEFDMSRSGISLCRDGYHLSLDYGRYTAAAVWLRTLSGKDVAVKEFEGLDIKLTEKILSVVNE